MSTENKPVPFLSDEQKPFNAHTKLPWKEGYMGNWLFGMPPEVGTGDVVCEVPSDAPDSAKNWPVNRAFILHACNTYYERESELQRVRGLLDEAREALGGMLDQFEHWEGAGGDGMAADAKVIKAARKAFRKLQPTK